MFAHEANQIYNIYTYHNVSIWTDADFNGFIQLNPPLGCFPPLTRAGTWRWNVLQVSCLSQSLAGLYAGQVGKTLRFTKFQSHLGVFWVKNICFVQKLKRGGTWHCAFFSMTHIRNAYQVGITGWLRPFCRSQISAIRSKWMLVWSILLPKVEAQSRNRTLFQLTQSLLIKNDEANLHKTRSFTKTKGNSSSNKPGN